MKRVALAWLCLLSVVAQISLLQSVAMADPSEASGASSSRVEARAAIRSRKLVTEAAAEPAPSVAEASEHKEESPAVSAAAAEAPAGTEAAAAAAAAATKHRSTDKSVAGGGVIIGGLVTAFFAAVFCYIRVTRKRDGGAR
ncbi:hypothetical protein NL676_017570 [Syzygium grande]|nr:hypothetical protein NL676_017570 [Syzygium grande]